jgi:acyl carrier protein
VRVDPAALRADTAPPLLRDLAPGRKRRAAASTEAAPDRSLESRLSALSGERRREVLLDLILTDVALVLGHGAPGTVSADGAFRDLGFDSLTAIELRNRLGSRTGVKLTATAVFDHPSPRALADHLLGRLVPDPAEPRSPAEPHGSAGTTSPAETPSLGEPTYERVMADLSRLRKNLAVLALTGSQYAELAETFRGMSEPWTSGAFTVGADDLAPSGLEAATASEVLDFVTNSLGISISGDHSPTDLG